MTCIWRIHGSKPYIVRWSLVYNTSIFCFSHFHLEWVGGWSEPIETNFIWKKLSHFATIPNLMLNSGKKFRALRIYSNSCVVRKKNSERNKKPYPHPLLQVKWSVPYRSRLTSKVYFYCSFFLFFSFCLQQYATLDNSSLIPYYNTQSELKVLTFGEIMYY